MKSVLISIQPKWCGLIANRKKTLELRKTRPKLETPIKCYIYCTKDQKLKFWRSKTYSYVDDRSYNLFDKCGNGRVIGEFICDDIATISVEYSDPNSWVALKEFPGTCLTDKQIIDYLGNGVVGYAWRISDLFIYDRPKGLSDFNTWKKCNSCRNSGYESTACMYDEDCMVPAVITRAPQSWCYVMEEG